MTVQSLKRGAIPTPRNVIAGATPYVSLIGAPPNFIMIPQRISMWGNDVNGDCVTAEEAFAKACNNPEIFISDDEVITWAKRHNALNGAVISEVMKWMQNDGFPDGSQIYEDGPYLSVNWVDSTILKSAISNGPVKIGIAANQIEAACQKNGFKTGWFGIGFQPDNAEDHCVSLCGYGTLAWLAQQLNVQVPAGIDGNQPGYAMFTWNSIGIIDEPSMIAVTHEAWLRQPTTVVAAPRRLVHKQSNKCLDGNAQGNVYLSNCESGNLYQAWKVIDVPGGFVYEQVATGRRLDAGSQPGGVYTNPPNPPGQDPNPYQIWKPAAEGGIVHNEGGVYLDGNGTNVYTNVHNPGNPYQVWGIEEVS